MGLAMASNLQRHLAAKKALGLVYSNRTLSRGEPLRELGGLPEKTFGDVVQKSSIIFTMVCIYMHTFFFLPRWLLR
jgi:3-hydroxyisobutyrate dehydrogenase-like beta-hydroxyacid dehydrogenase